MRVVICDADKNTVYRRDVDQIRRQKDLYVNILQSGDWTTVFLPVVVQRLGCDLGDAWDCWHEVTACDE